MGGLYARFISWIQSNLQWPWPVRGRSGHYRQVVTIHGVLSTHVIQAWWLSSGVVSIARFPLYIRKACYRYIGTVFCILCLMNLALSVTFEYFYCGVSLSKKVFSIIQLYVAPFLLPSAPFLSHISMKFSDEEISLLYKSAWIRTPSPHPFHPVGWPVTECHFPGSLVLHPVKLPLTIWCEHCGPDTSCFQCWHILIPR